MRYGVQVYRHVEHDKLVRRDDGDRHEIRSRDVKVGSISCTSRDEAERIVKAMTSATNLDARPCIVIYDHDGKTLNLPFVVVDELIEEYTNPARQAG